MAILPARYRRWMTAAALALIIAVSIGAAVPAGAIAASKPQRYIVVLKNTADVTQTISDFSAQHGVKAGHVFAKALRGFAASIPAGRLAALARDPRVALVEPDIEVRIAAEYRTGVDRVDAERHPLYGIGKQVDIDIAIIDTGIDATHPDLNVVGGVSFVPGVSSYNDDNGHGSHVAGISAAKYNGSGVAGVAPGARLWAVKVLSSGGSGYMSDIIKGIDWVTQRAGTIEVVNMSLGANGRSDAMRSAIQRCVSTGVVVVAAAGNSGQDVYGADGAFGTSDDFIPASYPEVAAISALSDTDGRAGGLGGSTDDTIASFSNFSRSVVSGNPVSSSGRAIDVAAPGANIYSTWMRGGYRSASGTSMAAPHASGVIALYMAANNSKPTSASGVYSIRQAVINAGQAQSLWRSDGNTRDVDGYREPLAYVNQTGSTPPPPAPEPDPEPQPEPVPGVSVSPASQSGQAGPGASAAYTFTVKNTGTAAASFSAATTAAWTASVTPSGFSLAAGASTTVKVIHAIPAGTASGSVGTGKLTVSSNGASASGTFSTTAQAPGAELTVKIAVSGAPKPGSYVELVTTVTDNQGRPVPYATVAVDMRTGSRQLRGTLYTNSYGVNRTWVRTYSYDYFPWTISATASKNGLTGSATITYPAP